MKTHEPRLKIGILGGGQLARMLALQAFPLGLEPWVLSANADDPAAQVTSHWIQGATSDPQALEKLFLSVDVVSFESEFLDARVLRQLEQKHRKPVRPGAELMGKLQDRLSQKQLLLDNRLPTAPFVAVNTLDDAEQALKRFKHMVLKQRRFGYDGYGTFVIRSRADLQKMIDPLAKNPHGFIAEALIAFKRELAVMGVRSLQGEVKLLPLVESFQSDSRCLWVKGPIKTPRWSALAAKLKRFLKAVDYVGIMGFELFDTPQGLMINELAPRVHNSGHYSLDALATDQFSLHLQAIVGLPMGEITLLSRGFAMYNLLGEGVQQPQWHPPSHVHLHWYGKNRSVLGRKMGHFNILGSSPDRALAQAKRARKDFKV